MALQPTVAATKSRTHVADTFAGARYCCSHISQEIPSHLLRNNCRYCRSPTGLLSGFPERVSNDLGLRAASNSDRSPVLGDVDAAQLGHVDFDAVGHAAEGRDGAVGGIEGEEREIFAVGILDLRGKEHMLKSKCVLFFANDILLGVLAYRLDDIRLSAGNYGVVHLGRLQGGPSLRGLNKVCRSGTVDLCRRGQFISQLGNVVWTLALWRRRLTLEHVYSRGGYCDGPCSKCRGKLNLTQMHCNSMYWREYWE